MMILWRKLGRWVTVSTPCGPATVLIMVALWRRSTRACDSSKYSGMTRRIRTEQSRITRSWSLPVLLSQWKKIGILTAIAASLAVLFLLLAEKKESIKIGAILSLSGPGSHVVDVKDGMMLAADEVNSRGGINGRKIKLIIEDSKTDIEQGKKAFNKIESAHHPLLYVSTLSSVSMALAPLAKENAVVLIGLVTSDPKLTGQNQWVFRYYTTAQYEVQSIMYILQKELRVKALGILYLNDEYGLSVFKLLKKEFEAVGGTVRAEPFEKNTI